MVREFIKLFTPDGFISQAGKMVGLKGEVRPLTKIKLSMKASFLMVKNMDREFFISPMGLCTKVNSHKI